MSSDIYNTVFIFCNLRHYFDNNCDKNSIL